MIAEAVFGTVAGATPYVVAGWTIVSFAVAAAWCVYRAPGRDRRLALDAVDDAD